MLTESKIKSAMRGCTKEQWLNDGATGRGGGSLCLRLRPSADGATATWTAKWKQGGVPATKQLGRYPDMTLAQAREKFREEVRPLLLAKKNPKTAAPAAHKPTVENLFKRYVDSLRAGGARSVDEIERVLLTGKFNAADALGRQRHPGDVDPTDVRHPLARLARAGSLRSADVQRTYMSAAFNWGLKSANDYTTENNFDWGIKQNPVAAVPKDARANKARDRNLSAKEVRVVWNAAPTETGDVLRLVIATGQRVLEVLRAEGRDLDLEGKVWRMPAEKTKGGKQPHDVPLTKHALEIFRRLIDWNGDGWLFPARAGAKGQIIGVTSVSQCAARIAGVNKFQPRDLRRTWKSRAGEAGVDRFTRDLIQQHARGDTGSKHYDRMDYMPQMRDGMTKWEAWLDAALNPSAANEPTMDLEAHA
jgi:integrase